MCADAKFGEEINGLPNTQVVEGATDYEEEGQEEQRRRRVTASAPRVVAVTAAASMVVVVTAVAASRVAVETAETSIVVIVRATASIIPDSNNSSSSNYTGFKIDFKGSRRSKQIKSMNSLPDFGMAADMTRQAKTTVKAGLATSGQRKDKDR
ncbi:hypothetical protein PoB_003735500 [Plakobranchus ocellatus]|uniref:Uncharacterized protein n=1 Tax=Plakobranchus ocellatus TaxID=259542 RepID=A0AAV4AU51_9GAST|nr:hypothetical protein PoB_003735500 [Plakobranchus ocellatus]